ncbi:putative aldouronate transport system substrate-binding protein [Kribbella aluminosa]|uniref:Aldouronate transport system substrate-binding protein n=1 Tax=Kribbella aluminosa TaxID=416017 RepID=A0ABS4UWV8_9ACTN|nr:extracellular solute-binding protein [Kribbella aluminosa]MBP2356117.1 putative aldouronate transport system substrate-binding protein [Kribbella aluminosa]
MYNPMLTRRRMLRNLAAAGATAAAGAAALAACSGGSGAKATKAGANYKPGSAGLKVKLGPEVEGVLYPDPFDSPRVRTFERFADGSKSFRVVGPTYPGLDYATNSFAQWLEKATGVKVQYDVVPGGEEGRPKINAMISSGNLPDAFLNGLNQYFTRSEVALYGQQGLFMPTDQLIDENCPEHLDLFKFRPELRPYLTAPDGKMYGFGYTSECYHCFSAGVRMWVDQEWLDKLGLEHPKTSDDLHAMLVAFRDRNPSGLSGTIPMSDARPSAIGGADGGGMINYLLSAFTYPAENYIDKQGDNLLFTPVQDSYREGLKWIRTLFAEKLIDPNAFTQTPAQLKGKLMNAKGPLVGAHYAYSTVVDFDPSPHSMFHKMAPLAPVTGPDGKAYIPWRHEPYASNGLVISSKCQDPVAMARWADAMIGVYGTLSQWQGPQGGKNNTFSWAAKGDKGIDGRQATWATKQVDPDQKNTGWWSYGPINNLVDVRHSQSADPAKSLEPTLYRFGRLYEPFAISKDRYFSEPIYTADQASQLSEVETNLANHLAQSTAQFCLGQLDINDDGAWQRYKEKFKQIGSEKYLQIQSDAMKASK